MTHKTNTNLHHIQPTGNNRPADVLADRMLGIVLQIEPNSGAVMDMRPNDQARVYGSAVSAAYDLAMAAYADFRQSPLVRLIACADGHTAQQLANALRDVAATLETTS